VIRAVISDFGGVLTSPLVPAFARFQEHAGVAPDALGRAIALATERAGGANPLFELECGRITETAFLHALEVPLAEIAGREVSLHEFTERWWSELHRNDEMLALMAELRSEGYAMALLTNNVREWEPRWRSMFAVDELFSVVVDSAFVGMRKPDPAIYALTLERIGVPAAQCLFVDDFEHNCVAAREAGMTAVCFQDTAQAVADVRAVLAGAAG
jgi:putative hydrolase of the HAD superfamily